MIRAVTAALAVALLAGTYQAGKLAERGRWEARIAATRMEQIRADARAEAATRALARSEAQRAELARQLEEQADADADAGRAALPARSLQRIGAR